MTIDEMRVDIARKNKRGISFIFSSVLIWIVILFIWRLPIHDILNVWKGGKKYDRYY